MVIVAGMYELAPELREAFLDSRKEAMRTSREETGCLEYVASADPIDPGRVIIFERWTSQEHLDAHLVAIRSRTGSAPIPIEWKKRSVMVYDVSAERPLI